MFVCMYVCMYVYIFKMYSELSVVLSDGEQRGTMKNDA